jgi:hypothetical protein
MQSSGAPRKLARYYRESYNLLGAYKKESIKKKQQRLLDQNNSDLITFSLYHKICEWALQAGLVFVWVSTVLQCN